MSKGLRGFFITTCVLLGFSSFFQFLAIGSVTNLFGLEQGPVEINFLSIWVFASILLPIAAILCGIFSKKENWPFLPMALAIVGAVLSAIVVISMGNVPAFQPGVRVNSVWAEGGLNSFRLLYRHWLPVLLGVFLAIISYLNHKNAKETRIRTEEEAYKEHYLLELDGDPVFKDAESTLGLNNYAEDFSVVKKTRKLKKSQRVAKAKLLEKKEKEKEQKK